MLLSESYSSGAIRAVVISGAVRFKTALGLGGFFGGVRCCFFFLSSITNGDDMILSKLVELKCNLYYRSVKMRKI